MSVAQLSISNTTGLQRLHGWRKEADEHCELADCSLVIPTYRRPKEMIALLEAIVKLPDPPGQVLVIDGSPEEMARSAVSDWASKQKLPFNLAYVKSPKGLTLQRNVGIDACCGEFVFFLDDDCIPKPGYFHLIHKAFLDDQNVEVGAIRGFITNGMNEPLTRIWRLRYALGLAVRGEPGKYYPTGTSGSWNTVQSFPGVRSIDVLAGGAVAYRREVFDKHRFSRFFYGYAQGEDLEMSRRMARDWKLLVCGDALVDHNHADHGRPPGLSRGRMASRNRHFIWKRHSPDARAIHKLKFWGDHALIVIYNLLCFARSPRRSYHLFYALGTLLGSLQCVVAPPRYQEPPAKKEYEICFEELARV